jgi:diaminopimelate decarboxylase
MNPFQYQNGELFAEQISLSEIATTFGTPCYVYSRAALEHNLMAYESALQDIPHLTCFAVKANSNLAVLNVLARIGAGFDIVSGGELVRVPVVIQEKSYSRGWAKPNWKSSRP